MTKHSVNCWSSTIHHITIAWSLYPISYIRFTSCTTSSSCKTCSLPTYVCIRVMCHAQKYIMTWDMQHIIQALATTTATSITTAISKLTFCGWWRTLDPHTQAYLSWFKICLCNRLQKSSIVGSKLCSTTGEA